MSPFVTARTRMFRISKTSDEVMAGEMFQMLTFRFDEPFDSNLLFKFERNTERTHIAMIAMQTLIQTPKMARVRDKEGPIQSTKNSPCAKLPRTMSFNEGMRHKS